MGLTASAKTKSDLTRHIVICVASIPLFKKTRIIISSLKAILLIYATNTLVRTHNLPSRSSIVCKLIYTFLSLVQKLNWLCDIDGFLTKLSSKEH